MNQSLLLALTCFLMGCSNIASVNAEVESVQLQTPSSSLQQKKWHHGAVDCSLDTNPAIDVYQQDESSFILRQNKCLNFEAPFIYVFEGNEKVLVVDTGATDSHNIFPVYRKITSLLNRKNENNSNNKKAWLVLHSHSHSDHHQGDSQFKGHENITIVEPNSEAVNAFFNFEQQKNHRVNIDLGQRKISIFAIPGHQEDSIAIYDHHTKWLLTGDTLYPGYIYVKDWQEYRKSIAKLSAFAQSHDVSAVLGAHIEMKKEAQKYYEIGSQFQPNEHALPLSVSQLVALNAQLTQHDEPTKITFNSFIIAPMSGLQKTLSNIAKWIFQ